MNYSGRAPLLAVAALTATALVLASCATEDGGQQDAVTTTDPVEVSRATTQDAPSPTPAADGSGDQDAEGDGDPGDTASDPLPTSGDPDVQDALTALAVLEVKGRAPKTGYSRDEFGQRWKDIDRNGCDQRIIYTRQLSALWSAEVTQSNWSTMSGALERGTYGTTGDQA
ncbi:MAG: hypothetical protein ACTH1D_13260 [Mycobacteriaceae bacterium]